MIQTNIEQSDVIKALCEATKDVLDYETDLLERGNSERSVVHWLANYFFDQIKVQKSFQPFSNFFL